MLTAKIREGERDEEYPSKTQEKENLFIKKCNVKDTGLATEIKQREREKGRDGGEADFRLQKWTHCRDHGL